MKILKNGIVKFEGFMKWVKENCYSMTFAILAVIGVFLLTMYIIESINYHKLVTQFNEKWGKTEIAKPLQREQVPDTVNWVTLISIDATNISCPFYDPYYKEAVIKTQHDMIIEIDSIFPKWMDTLVIVKHSTGDTIKVALENL